MKRIFKTLLSLFILLQGISNFAQTNTQLRRGKVLKEKPTTVFLIGIDGLSVDGLTKANTPTMDMFVKIGASSLKARGVMPTSSGPNWGSMLLGAGPEQHGITSNGWRVNDYSIEATIKDGDGFFPSVFDMIKKEDSKSKLGVFHEWGTIRDLFNTKVLHHIEKTGEMNESLDKAFAYFKKERPKFVFVHLDAVDGAGHKFGHGSAEYYQEIERIDNALGSFYEKLNALNKEEGTVVNILVTSDHGGVGTSHGGSTMEEIIIPWILVGPNVKRGHTIEQPINTYDTPATILRLLDADRHIPIQWTGKPVLEAIKN